MYCLPLLVNLKKLSIKNLTGGLANVTLTMFPIGGKSLSPVCRKSLIIAGAFPLQSIDIKRFLDFSQNSCGKAIYTTSYPRSCKAFSVIFKALLTDLEHGKNSLSLSIPILIFCLLI